MNLETIVLSFEGGCLPEVLTWGKAKMDSHWHLAQQIMSRHALVFITQGQATFHIDQKPLHVQSGDVFLIRKGQLLASEAVPINPFECAWVHFEPLPNEKLLSRAAVRSEWKRNQSRKPISTKDGLFLTPQSRFSRIYIPLVIRLIETQSAAMQMIESSLEECRQPATGSALRVSLCLSSLFVLISRETIPTLLDNEGKNEVRTVPSLVQNAVNAIRAKYAEPMTVQSLSRQLRVTPQHLIRVFRKCLKVSPLDYIHSVRMERAREMLRLSRLSIKEICQATGFRDARHFTHLFSRLHGYPPTKYRESARRIQGGFLSEIARM